MVRTVSRRFKQWLNKVVRSVQAEVRGSQEVTSRVTVGQIKVMEVRIWVNKRTGRSKHGANDGTGGYGRVNVSSGV